MAEGVTVEEVSQDAVLNEKCMEMKNRAINIKDLSKPLLEDDEEEFKLPEADVTPDGNSTDDKSEGEDKKDDNKDKTSNTSDEEKEKKRALILNITSEDDDGESSEDADEDSDKSEKRAEILSVEGQSDDDLADEGNTDEDKKDDEDSDDEDSGNEDNKDDKSDETETSEEAETTTAKAERIEAETKKDMEEFQDLLDNLEKKESIKEQIINHYPFAVSLSPDNFAKFAALKPTQKKKCMKFIIEHNIYTINDINEQWDTPLISEKRVLKNWLRLADPKDIELYTKASLQEQDAIENMARYWILETKQDVDEFWEKTGLRTREAQRIMNEEFVRRYKVA